MTHPKCSSEAQICDLKLEAEKIHQAIIAESLQEQPYLEPSLSSRTRRGLMDGVGQIDKYLCGIATTADGDSLHTSEVEMAERIKWLQDSLVKEHKYLKKLTGYITAWSSELSEAFERRTCPKHFSNNHRYRVSGRRSSWSILYI